MNVIRRTVIPTLGPVLLALVLALTSLTMAAARGQATAVGSMVICSGQGSYTVLVDAEGKPTGAAHLCPDCALSLFALDMGAQASSHPVRQWRIAHAPVFTALAEGSAVFVAKARGPPGLV